MKFKTKKSETDTLDAWAREYHGPLLRYFRKRTPTDIDPSDLVQEVFCRLAKRADLSSIVHVEGYVFQTAVSVLADTFRRRAKIDQELSSPFEEKTHGLTVITPEDVLIDVESIQILIDALSELPERDRAVFVLYHFENIQQKEIAARLDVGLRTVERSLAKVLAHILKRLKWTDGA